MNNTATLAATDALNNSALSGFEVMPGDDDSFCRVLVRTDRENMEAVRACVASASWVVSTETGFCVNGRRYWVITSEEV